MRQTLMKFHYLSALTMYAIVLDNTKILTFEKISTNDTSSTEVQFFLFVILVCNMI